MTAQIGVGSIPLEQIDYPEQHHSLPHQCHLSGHSSIVRRHTPSDGPLFPTQPAEGRGGRPGSARPSTSSGRPSTSRTDDMHFAYDRVFDDGSSQEEIYEQSCKPIVVSVLEGYNGTVLAYGQTGTGKTYTMEGSADGENRGIIPRAANEIFEYIQEDKPEKARTNDGKQSQWLVRCSFLQIYNEKITDLLTGDTTEKKIRERANGEVYVEGLSEHVVQRPSDIYKLLNDGRSQRNTNSTKMNHASSRSHAVFTIIVEHSLQDSSVEGYSDVTVGKLHLVDLAGSERFEVTDEDKHHRETIDINRSLSAFGKVVLALTSRGSQHVPYRDSKLTRILQDSLGGNSKTTMISTITSSSVSFLESASTLKFANRAKNVKNVAQVNKDVSESAMLTAMSEEIRKLQQALSEKQSQANPVSDEEIARLQAQSKKSQIEKSVIVSELAKRQREVQAAQRERDLFLRQIQELQGRVVQGGTEVQETAVFKAAIAKEKSKLLEEQSQQRNELAEERRKLQEEKAKFERERRSFKGLVRAVQLSNTLGQQAADTETGSEAAQSPAASASAIGSKPSGEASPLQPRPPSTPFADRLASKYGDVRRRASLESAKAHASPDAPENSSPPGRTTRQARSTSETQMEMHSSDGSDYSDGDGTADAANSSPLRKSIGSSAVVRERPSTTGAVARRGMKRSTTAPTLSEMEAHGGDRMADAREPDTKTSEEIAIDRYSRALQHPETGIPLSTRRIRLTTYKLCFSGVDAAGWFMTHMNGVHTAEQAQKTGQQLLDLGIIAHVRLNKKFVVTENDLYQFRKANDSLQQGEAKGRPKTASGLSRRHSASSVSRSSLSSSRSSLSRSRTWSSRLSMSSIRSDNSLASLAVGLQQGAGGSFEEYADESSSPLHIAAARGEIGAIRTLMSDLSVDERDGSGRTPLMYAVIGNRAKACKYLIKNHADVNARDDNGNTPLMWSACRGCREAMKELLKMGADVAQADSAGRTALHWSTKLVRLDCLDYLLRCAYRAVVNKRDDEHLTPLHWAVMCDHVGHVEALLRGQADPIIGDADGRTSLHYAVSRNAIACLTVLMEHCRHCINAADGHGRTALHAACAEGTFEAVQILLSTPGIDVNATDQRMTTPLHWAAVCNRPDICSLLMQNGAQLMARDAQERTALHYATEKGHLDCASVMQRMSGASGAKRAVLGSTVPPPQYGGMPGPSPTRSAVSAQVPSGREMWSPSKRQPEGAPPPYSRGRRRSSES